MKYISLSAALLLSFIYADRLYAQSKFTGARAHPIIRQSKTDARSMSIQGLQNEEAASIFQNIDITSDLNDDQNEPSISINPINPLNIAIGEVDDRSYDVLWYCTSSNGGKSWLADSLPADFFNGTTQFDNATDPGVVFDQDGGLFFSNVFYQDLGFNEEACYKSSDDGLSWIAPIYVGGDTITGFASVADRDYITVDRDAASPFFSRVYIVWVSISYPTSVIVESHSTDHGSSWTLPAYVSPVGVGNDTLLFQGPIPACGPNGELYITYADRDSTSKKILVARSTDGGASFAQQVTVSVYQELGPVVPDNFDGHPEIKGNVETNSFPSIAVGRSNQHKGRIYVTWCGRDTDNSAHVFLSTSDDSGQTWTTPRHIDNDSSAVKTDKFFPWAAVDQSSGDIGVTFYDSRNDPDSNILVDDYLTLSTDGGATFTSRRISNASSDPHVCRDVVTVDNVNLLFFGDYISLDAMDSVWYPVWTDTRSGTDQDIYMSVVQPYAPMPVANLASHDTTIAGKTETVLTWNYNPETTFGFPLTSGYQFIVSKDTSQLAVQTSGSLTYLDTNNTFGSVYRVIVRSGGFQSVPDSLGNSRDAAAADDAQISSIRFLNDPAIAGCQDEMKIESSEDCSVVINFYDELGRNIGAAISDGIISSRHNLSFMPQTTGVKFYVLKESNSLGMSEVVGKLSVLGQ